MAEQVGWVGTRSGAVYAGWHLPERPEGEVRATSVIIVPPFGWEAVSAGRNLRALARGLAGAGYPTLRYQPPGSGDSDGAAPDADLEGWKHSLQDLVALVRGHASPHVTVVALGLGCVTALQAASEGGIDELVLWSASGTGRRLLRELRAFASLAAEPGDRPAEPPRPLDAVTSEDGSLWVHGYPLNPAAQEQLAAFDVGSLELGKVRRALVLGRGTLPVDSGLMDALAAAGVDATSTAGPGYDQLTAEPRLSQPPVVVTRTLHGWLRPDVGGPTPSALPTVARPEQRRQLADLDVVVTPAAQADVTAVFLSAGAIHRAGPNRLWTECARAWAGEGVASIRVDLPDVGEAAGPDALLYGPEVFYQERHGRQLRQLLDTCAEWDLPQRFVLIGLCSGGYWAADTALRDPRVEGIVILNSGSLIWPPPLFSVASRSYLRSAATWSRLLRERSLRQEALGRLRTTVRGHLTARAEPRTTIEVLERLASAGSAVSYGVSPGEPVLLELEGLTTDSGVDLVHFEGPSGAHTLATHELRAQAVRLLDDTVRRVRHKERPVVAT